MNFCEDKEIIEKLFFERIFFKIWAELRKRNMTPAMMFKKMDTNDDQFLDPNELETGLRTMKIFLNGRNKIALHDKRDFNKLWSFFDRDHNNQITCEEFEEIMK